MSCYSRRLGHHQGFPARRADDAFSEETLGFWTCRVLGWSWKSLPRNENRLHLSLEPTCAAIKFGNMLPDLVRYAALHCIKTCTNLLRHARVPLGTSCFVLLDWRTRRTQQTGPAVLQETREIQHGSAQARLQPVRFRWPVSGPAYSLLLFLSVYEMLVMPKVLLLLLAVS